MANYKITGRKKNLISASAPTNWASVVILTLQFLAQKISKLRKALTSIKLVPISGSCPILALVQESPSTSGGSFPNTPRLNV